MEWIPIDVMDFKFVGEHEHSLKIGLVQVPLVIIQDFLNLDGSVVGAGCEQKCRFRLILEIGLHASD